MSERSGSSPVRETFVPVTGAGLDTPFQTAVPDEVTEPWPDYSRNGYHHPQTTALVTRLVGERPDTHFWELSTRHGYYPVLARRTMPSCDVTVFDDDPDRLARIGRSFTANDCGDFAAVPRRVADGAAEFADPPTVVHAAGNASVGDALGAMSTVLVEHSPAIVLELDVGEFVSGDRQSFVAGLPRTGYDYYWAQKPSRSRSRWASFDPTMSLPSQNTTCLLVGLPAWAGDEKLRAVLGSGSVVGIKRLAA